MTSAGTGGGWLVLGQSFDRGWRASCDGRELGPPRPMQGYANAWSLPATCERAAFRYVPDRAVRLAMLLSGGASVLLLLALLLRPRPHSAPPAASRVPTRPARTSRRARRGAGRWRSGWRPAGGRARHRAARGARDRRGGRARGPPGDRRRPLLLTAVVLLGVAVPAAYLLVAQRIVGGFSPPTPATDRRTLAGRRWRSCR
jgi:hypothetical protein